MIHKKVYINTTLETKGVELDNQGGKILKIAGFANASTKDRGNEIITPEAWRKGIENYKKNSVLLFNHDMSKPIGTVTAIKVTEDGLYVEANVSSAAEKLYGTQTLIIDGALKAFSVGFYPKKGKRDSATNTLYITEVELLENSIVSVPMNQDSLFSVIKSMSDDDREAFLANVEEFDSSKEAAVEMSVADVTITDPELIEAHAKLVGTIASKPDATIIVTEGSVSLAVEPTQLLDVNSTIIDTDSREFLLPTGKKVLVDSHRFLVIDHDIDNHSIEAQQITILGNPINNILKIDDRSIVMLNLNQVNDTEILEFKSVAKRDNAQIEELFKTTTEKTTETPYTKYTAYLSKKDVKDWNSDDYVVANKIIEYVLHRSQQEATELSGHVEEINPMTKPTEENNSVEVKTAPIEATVAAVVQAPKVLELPQAAAKAVDAVEIAKENNASASQVKALEDRLEAVMAEFSANREKLAAANNEKIAYAASQASGPSRYTSRDVAVATMLTYGRNASTGQQFSLETFKNNSELGRKILEDRSQKATITTVDALITDFTSEIYKQMEIELKVAPMFRTLDVTAQNFKVPVADEDTNGDIAMFANGTYNVGETDSTRVPTTRQNTITAVNLTPHKFMGTTHLAKDEQEDVLVPLLQFQIEALTRRMARAIDKSLLRGDGSLTGFTASPTNAITAGSGYTSVITGLVSLAETASLKVSTGGTTTKATPTTIASLRAMLGRYGLEVGANLVYFTSIEGYNDLVTTSDFRTIDKFGDKATYFTGQVGSIYGIPVVVTEFLDVVGVSGNQVGALVYLPGFIIGRRRSLEVETWYDPRRQLNTVYLSTRFDMKALTTVSGAALNTSGYSFAAIAHSA